MSSGFTAQASIEDCPYRSFLDIRLAAMGAYGRGFGLGDRLYVDNIYPLGG
jgi:hypothetical protein